MNQTFKKLIRYFLKKAISRQKANIIILFLSKQYNLDLLDIAHSNIGIMKYENPQVSGEAFLMNNIIPNVFKKNKIETPILFDIGANNGKYSIELCNAFPNAKIFAFEPNPNTFNLLEDAVGLNKNIKCFKFGFGSASSTSLIFTYKNDLVSEHATVYRNVLVDFHKSHELEEIEIKIETLDDFLSTQMYDTIDFLKIDTEGHELEVFKGAKKLISEKKVNIIQFEFNEMNVASRVFLQDFYSILKGYSIYRLDTNRLISMIEYYPKNEIFRFQNIIAIREELLVS